jgi:hypothetical protein
MATASNWIFAFAFAVIFLFPVTLRNWVRQLYALEIALFLKFQKFKKSGRVCKKPLFPGAAIARTIRHVSHVHYGSYHMSAKLGHVIITLWYDMDLSSRVREVSIGTEEIQDSQSFNCGFGLPHLFLIEYRADER